VSTQTLNAMANIQPKTTSFSLFLQKDLLPDLSTKCICDLDATSVHTGCPQSSTLFIAPTRDSLETNAFTNTLNYPAKLSQTSFSYISINSLTIFMVSIAMKSSWRDLIIDANHVLR